MFHGIIASDTSPPLIDMIFMAFLLLATPHALFYLFYSFYAKMFHRCHIVACHI